MCDCMRDRVDKLKELKKCDIVFPPVEAYSGRAYLSFTARKTAGDDLINIPLLLKNCPFCGEPYELT